MEKLSNAEQNLVALGAALGSNCVPSTEHYVREARRGGFNDRQIDEAICLADSVCHVPAQNVLDRALGLLSRSVNPGAEPRPETPRADEGRQTATEEKPDRADTRSRPPGPDRKSCCC